MAESSITLPNCKIVIDLCLTRKIFSNSVSGISRFETRLASKANLSQRAGRVGRVSNGTVYRLISRSDYESLAEYDIPEIKCVSLEIIILRAKQLDLINKKDIFTDPYAILLSGIEPPHIRDIDLAVEALLRE